jgi:hypothetical protein
LIQTDDNDEQAGTQAADRRPAEPSAAGGAAGA